MNMGKTVLAQRILINYFRERGYTDMKFIGVDCVPAVDQDGIARSLGVNKAGVVINLGTWKEDKSLKCEISTDLELLL